VADGDVDESAEAVDDGAGAPGDAVGRVRDFAGLFGWSYKDLMR
jgi:hypothetical protein